MRHRPAAVLLLIALLASLSSAAPGWGQAKAARVGVLNFMDVTEDPTWTAFAKPLRRKLAENGWVEGKNLTFEHRSAHGDPSELAQAARELVELKVDVIFATAAPTTRAAFDATRTIPIVGIDYTNDPVAIGYAESYSRPGGNVTGIFLDAPHFAGNWLQLLSTTVPGLSRVAVLWDPSPGSTHLQAIQTAAQSSGVRLQVIQVLKPDDLDKAFSALRGKPQAVIILPSPMMYAHSARLARLAMKYRMPATSMARGFAEAGGIFSYGPDQASTNERVAVFVSKILGGARPGDLPMEAPSKVHLVVNLRSAEALGLTVPDAVLFRADQVVR